MSGCGGLGALRGVVAYQPGAGATYADMMRLSAFLATRPDAHVYCGEFGEWFCDVPDARMHAGTLGRLLDRLDAPAASDAPGTG